jgi:hypothetical protein
MYLWSLEVLVLGARIGPWGLPLIILNVVFHAWALGLINKDVIRRLSSSARPQYYAFRSVFVIGGTALSATMLHALEVLSWAATYRLLGGLPDNKSAILYSLNAMTSYGRHIGK